MSGDWNTITDCETGETWTAPPSTDEVGAMRLRKMIKPRTYDEQMAILRGAANDAA